MRRPRRIGVFALASSCVLLATPAPAIGQPDSRAGAQTNRSHGNVTFVPVSADVQIIRTGVTADGQKRTQPQTDHFYRDSHGRTRQESGPLVTITDPSAGTTVTMNVQTRTFQRTTADPAAQRPESASRTSPAVLQPTFSPRRSLGSTQVSGVLAQGTAYTITSPRPNAKPVTQDVTVCLSCGVVAEQVVQGVPARAGFLDQVGSDQPVQPAGDGLGRLAGQRRCRRYRQVRPRSQPEQPEQPPRVRGRYGVRLVERDPYGRLGVFVHLQRRQAVPGTEPGHVVADRNSRAGCQVCGSDPQGERKVRTHAGQLGDRRRLGAHPCDADEPGQ